MIWFGLLLLVIGCFAVAWYGSSEIMNVPYLSVPYTPKDFDCAYEEVFFETDDRLRLRAWFVPATQPSDTTIFILHGQGSNAGDNLQNTICLQRRGGWNLFYYDFRGHGGSQGDFTSLGALELGDFLKAIDFFKTRFPQAAKRLAVYGHSMGGAVAIEGTAERTELLAVAAESPFASISRTVRHFTKVFYGIPTFPFVWFTELMTAWRLGIRFGEFDPEKAIPQISPRPVFLIRPGRDTRIPITETERLWNAAKEPKEQWIVPEAEHGDAWMIRPQEYEDRLVGFFQRSLA